MLSDADVSAAVEARRVEQPDALTAPVFGMGSLLTEGDHLWALAERRVSAVLGRPAADHEIAPYWRDVISSNPELRSGDPDIIYPGEVIVLPPLD